MGRRRVDLIGGNLPVPLVGYTWCLRQLWSTCMYRTYNVQTDGTSRTTMPKMIDRLHCDPLNDLYSRQKEAPTPLRVTKQYDAQRPEPTASPSNRTSYHYQPPLPSLQPSTALQHARRQSARSQSSHPQTAQHSKRTITPPSSYQPACTPRNETPSPHKPARPAPAPTTCASGTSQGNTAPARCSLGATSGRRSRTGPA